MWAVCGLPAVIASRVSRIGRILSAQTCRVPLTVLIAKPSQVFIWPTNVFFYDSGAPSARSHKVMRVTYSGYVSAGRMERKSST